MAKVFFSYSHKDEIMRDALEVHLSVLIREGLIETLHDRRITAGEDLDAAIDSYLESSNVILCLVSPDFIASNYCYSREMKRALERHDAGEAVVIPVILRHCEWQKAPLGKLRATPKDGKPIRAWPDQDEAFNDVAQDVRRVIEQRFVRVKPAAALAKTAETPLSSISRPRSANLHVTRIVSDLDRDEHVRAAFEFVIEFFANSLEELKRRHSGIDGRATRLDANRLIASAYLEGRKVSAITIFRGGHTGEGPEINFNNSDGGQTNTMNGSFHLSEERGELKFQSIFGTSRSGTKSIDQQALAEEIWAIFIEPLQRRR